MEESTEAQNRKVVRVGKDWKPKEDVLEFFQRLRVLTLKSKIVRGVGILRNRTGR